MIRGRDDAGQIPLAAGIALRKFLFPFIVERRQFVIMAVGDRLEIDGLPVSGSVVSHNATGVKPMDFRLPCSSQWPC